MQGIYTTGSSAGYILQGVQGIYTAGSAGSSAGYILQEVQGVVHGIYCRECRVYTAE